MKTKQTSAFKLAKNMVPVGLLLTIQQQSGVEATQVDTQAHIQEIASLVSSALASSEEGAQLESGLSALSEQEINAQIHSTIEEAIKSENGNKSNSKLGFLQKVVTLDCFFGGSDCLFKDKKSMMNGQVTEFAKKRFEAGNQDVGQYLAQVQQQVNQDLQASAAIKSIDNATQQPPHAAANLQTATDQMYYGEQNEKQLRSQLHDSVQGLLKLNQNTEEDNTAPRQAMLINNQNKAAEQQQSVNAQLVKVPIDEKEAIGLTVSPTYGLDDVMSVTLKAFRKVVGYDTFDSIRRGKRDEQKDTSDYYNVTVSMMIKRRPAEPAQVYTGDIFAGGKSLKDLLDKGFPYDDGDIDLTSKGVTPVKTVAQVVGKLNGENITKQNLKNLVTDKTTPVTGSLVQLDSSKSDADGLFKLMDANVTRGNLKNLVTDKPSPITVGLAQKSDADGLFKLMDANVTRGNLKNLVTDKPSPITVGLAQKSDADGLFKLMDANVTRGNLKNLVTDKPSPITVGLAQTKSSGIPVLVNPESVLYPNTQAATNFGFVDIPVGLDEVSFVQHKENMKFMPLGQNVQKPGNLAIVERNGNAIELAQTSSKIMPSAPNTQQPGNLAIVERNVDSNPIELAQTSFMPSAPNTQQPGNLAIVERNGNAIELAQTSSKIMPSAPNTQQPGNLAIVERNVDSNPIELAQTSVPPVDSSVVQATAPGDFSIVDHEAVDSTLLQTSNKVTQKSANGLN